MISIPYWWSNAIAKQREECNSARRRLTRSGKRPGINMEGLVEPTETDKLKKKELAKQTRDAKKRHWDSLRQELKEDIWGGAYKIVTKRLNILTQYELNIDRKRHVVKGLFPSTRE
ncbi:hypothetical protein QE152_g26566 [Popillia japonica]|uniref:Uncharacterized protein n=1 Tax=Popillia japonica TaxID=7064 RepID=A0AAW1JWP4_POPJA